MWVTMQNAYGRGDVQYPQAMKLLRFAFSGSVGLLLNLAILHLSVQIFGLWYVYAAVIAFVFSYTVSFFLQKVITFRDISTDRIHVQYGAFLVLAAINIVVNITIVYVGVEYLRLHYLLAQMFASFSVAIESFWMYRSLFNPYR